MFPLSGPILRTGIDVGNGPDERPGLGGVPFGGANKPAKDQAIRRNEQGGRQADGLEPEACPGARIIINGEMGDFDVAEKLFDALKSGLIDAEGDDFHPVAAYFALELFKGRHFMAAGRAPGRPQVQQHKFASEQAEIMLFPVHIHKADSGHGRRVCFRHKVLHCPLCLPGNGQRRPVCQRLIRR